jgi:hypothetical protein
VESKNTKIAQTDVSRLGKIFIMIFFPLSSESERLPRSDLTSVKSGALLPLNGRFPEVLIGFPFNVIFAIGFFSNVINLLHEEKDEIF